MQEYGVGSRDYLQRARALFKDGSPPSLVYAALELRCGVEARLQEYLEPQAHIPEKRRTEWSVKKLHRTTEEVFALGDRVGRLRIISRPGKRVLAILYYTPVSARLKEIAERLGDYLHSPREAARITEQYWGTLRELVREGTELLGAATTGTLLGPVLRDSSTGQALVRGEVLPDDQGATVNPLDSARNASVTLEIRYYATFADAYADA